MKKYIVLFIISIIPFFSFANDKFSDYIGADNGGALQNIYANTYKYYQKNLEQTGNKAIKSIAGDIGVSTEYIEDVLNGNLTVCAKFFDKLNIDTKDGAEKADFQSCYNQISSKYQNYMQVSLSNKQLSDALSTENILTDSDNNNSPYDLLVDIQDIGSLLFKKEVSIEFGNISMKQEDINNLGKNNSKDNRWLPSYKSFEQDNNNNNNNNEETESKKDYNKSENEGNEGNEEENINENFNELTNSNIINTENNSQLNTNNLQLGNKCLTQESNGNIVNNNEIVNNGNDGFGNINNPNDNNGNNNFNNISFDTFLGNNINGGDFDLSLEGIFDGKDSKNKDELASSLGGGSKMCSGKDQLLAVCIQLIPSGPNGPVGGTVEKNTLEGIIEQISNTLKDIRQSFIIPAGHGDEALDIDFKHVKFADIFAFNIISSKKPVFRFDKDKNVEKQKNKADTVECKGVPRLLSSFYNTTSIAYCDNKTHDQNKYLITNLDNINIKNREPIKPAEKTTTNSADGSFKQIELYTQYNENLLSFMTNLESLMLNWQSASATLKAKSE